MRALRALLQVLIGTGQVASAFEDDLAHYWEMGNAAVRLALFAVLADIFALIGMAFLPLWLVRVTVPIIVFLPIFGVICLLFAHPLVSLAAATLPLGNNLNAARSWILRKLTYALGIETIAGLYLCLVPTSDNRGLIMPLVLAAIAASCFRLVGAKTLSRISTMAFVVITIMLLRGGSGPVNGATRGNTADRIGPQSEYREPDSDVLNVKCGELISADYGNATKLRRVIVVLPPNCSSGAIKPPNKTTGISTCASAPITGDWYFPNAPRVPVPFTDRACGEGYPDATQAPRENEDHTWGIPIALGLQNPQPFKVKVIVTFQGNP